MSFFILTVVKELEEGLLSSVRAHPLMSTASKFSSYERMHVRLRLSQTILNLVVVYCPPQAATSVFLNEFLRYLDELNTGDGRLLIVGDFYFHMNDCENSSSAAFHKVLDIFSLK